MQQNAILNDLDTFLSRSRDLLKLAGKGDWQNFEGLRARRDEHLPVIGQALEPALFNDDNLLQTVRDRLEDISAINKRLVRLAKKNEKKTHSEYREVGHAEKALKAYGE